MHMCDLYSIYAPRPLSQCSCPRMPGGGPPPLNIPTSHGHPIPAILLLLPLRSRTHFPPAVRLQDMFKCDIFSLGVVLCALLCGRLPFQSTEHREASDETAVPLLFQGGEELSAEAKDFVTSLLGRMPCDRPSTSTALAHSWLAGHRQGYEEPDLVELKC